MIEVKNLRVAVGKKEILNSVNLKVERGEIAVIFGPNGCGKTTLLNTLMGLGNYRIKSGEIKFKDKVINDWPIEKRAKAGIGLLWQKPPKVKGVMLTEVLKFLNTGERDTYLVNKFKADKFLNRGLNEDLSGGELKRSELLQLSVQNADLFLLDEPDSGVDLENCKIIAKIVEGWRKEGKIIILVTHSGSLLKYVQAKKSYVMLNGEIRCQGKPEEMLSAITKCGYQGCIDCQRRRLNV